MCQASFLAVSSSVWRLPGLWPGLDSQTGREVLGYLQLLNNEGRTIVLITHDNAIARQAQRIIRLEDGKIVYDGQPDSPEAVVQAEEGMVR